MFTSCEVEMEVDAGPTSDVLAEDKYVKQRLIKIDQKDIDKTAQMIY